MAETESIGCPSPNCTLPVDLRLRSNGGSVIGAHVSMLGEKTGAFPTDDMVKVVATDSELVDCPVRKEVLKVFLDMLHDDDQLSMNLSTISALDDDTMLDLVAAAELYQAEKVKDVCDSWIKLKAPERPWLAFRYALKHRDISTLDRAAPYTLGSNLKVAYQVDRLDHLTARAWYKYREPYIYVIDTFLAVPVPQKNSKRKLHSCGGWDYYEADVKGDVAACTVDGLLKKIGPPSGAETVFSARRWLDALPIQIVNRDPMLHGKTCGTCRTRANRWEMRVRARVRALAGHKFSDVLRELDPIAFESG
ncbi:hypothetical protein DFP72DRAFT_905570 [Ephemerocybe angulata]|uniref:Uncharacterized protein n=1 Tax=Ephemerocybe angulata TaxID=980116 RepID=A0A8H6HTU9_9AGAR|nr:hypothetical protein DFP72DRAFT_905570 [Tulosesus angulatus]